MPDSVRLRTISFWYASTVLVSAFLVFQVQPVISKFILPWFGGSPAVWTTCLLFFQVVLFAGYLYAHAVTRYLQPRWQGLLHLLLIVAAVLLLPITPDAGWKPVDSHHPTWRILCLLGANVGVPYFLLSTTGPLIQAWFSRCFVDRSPYRLYALSNAGSLLALLSYPFLVEPMWGSSKQGQLWSLGFALFALFGGYCAWHLWVQRGQRIGGERGRKQLRQVAADEPRPTVGRQLSWLALAACASAMLLATTNHVCQDVAVVPFLWVVPLSLYLLSFIICFEYEHWYCSRWFGLATAVSIVAVSGTMLSRSGLSLALEVGIYFAALLCICMLCHGELVRRKPAPQHLTSFYLMSAGGGALGGLFVAVLAPIVFPTYLEMNLGLLIGYLLGLGVMVLSPRCNWFARGTRRQLVNGAVAFAGLLIVVNSQAGAVLTNVLDVSRNFYGVLCIDVLDANDPAERRMMMRHGRILHGVQYLADQRRGEPTIFFARHTGVGLAIKHHHGSRPQRVGVVGLGAGTLAAYGRPGDAYRFYEINPEVLRLAEEHFTYLDDCQAELDVILGDARLSLEREPSQQFDVLVLDAFSGDAIPAHLLTRESMEIYRRHLKPDGVIAVHISNRHVDLRPVIRALADEFGFQWRTISSRVKFSRTEVGTGMWALLSSDGALFDVPEIREQAQQPQVRPVLWTDDYSNLFEILK